MIGVDGRSPADGARGGPQPGRDCGPARRTGLGIADDRRGARMAGGRRVGAGRRSARGASLRGALACGRRGRRRLRASQPRDLTGRRRGAPRTRLAERGAGLDSRRARRRQLPEGCRGSPRRPGRRILLSDPQREGSPGGDGVLHRRAARAGPRAAGDDGQHRRPDRPGRRAPPRRRGVARQGSAPSRDARCRPRLHRDHGP